MLLKYYDTFCACSNVDSTFFLAYGRVCRQGQQQCKIHSSKDIRGVAKEVLEILDFLALY